MKNKTKKVELIGVVMPSLIIGSCIDVEKPFVEKYYRIESGEFLRQFDYKRVKITIVEMPKC